MAVAVVIHGPDVVAVTREDVHERVFALARHGQVVGRARRVRRAVHQEQHRQRRLARLGAPTRLRHRLSRTSPLLAQYSALQIGGIGARTPSPRPAPARSRRGSRRSPAPIPRLAPISTARRGIATVGGFELSVMASSGFSLAPLGARFGAPPFQIAAAGGTLTDRSGGRQGGRLCEPVALTWTRSRAVAGVLLSVAAIGSDLFPPYCRPLPGRHGRRHGNRAPQRRYEQNAVRCPLADRLMDAKSPYREPGALGMLRAATRRATAE